VTPVDVAIIGSGMSGFATSCRLAARGLSTLVLESHAFPGGCAGFWRHRGFSFDVGATTFVDFEPAGLGGRFLDDIGLGPLPGEVLPGYRIWLPDGEVTLWRDRAAWSAERLRAFGDDAAHRGFWALIDRVEQAFWRVSRGPVRMPLRTVGDVASAARLLGPADWGLARYLRWTMGDALRAFGLRDDRRLATMLGMVLEDTVHAAVDDAPFVNAAMGANIRGAGLTRFQGGARGFWKRLVHHHRVLGGQLWLNCPVSHVERAGSRFRLDTARGPVDAGQVVSAVPIDVAARLGPSLVGDALAPYVARDRDRQGGAVVVFLGVPDAEVAVQPLTHHGLFQDYDEPFGEGNNMFVSVSAPDDRESAPAGHRAVMVSTHTEVADWEGLSDADYARKKSALGERLVALARRVYPDLGRAPVWNSVGTPRTYARFTGRARGAVGGVRQTLGNTNQRAVPHDVGVPGFFLVGDTTWPGLGTVSCVLQSRIAAEAVLAGSMRSAGRPIGRSVGQP
jgi:C-3',4' desaturase CrtD